MAFAIFYDMADLVPFTTDFTAPTLSGSDKTLATKIWNGGLSGWQSAPVAPPQYQQGDPDTRILVINATNVTKQNMIDLLRRVAPLPGCGFLRPIADDMVTSAIEPWP
jgi:hypothetical protein